MRRSGSREFITRDSQKDLINALNSRPASPDPYEQHDNNTSSHTELEPPTSPTTARAAVPRGFGGLAARINARRARSAPHRRAIDLAADQEDVDQARAGATKAHGTGKVTPPPDEQAALAHVARDVEADEFKLPYGDQPLAPHPLSDPSDQVGLPLGSSVPTLHRHAGEPKLALSARPRSAPSRSVASVPAGQPQVRPESASRRRPRRASGGFVVLSQASIEYAKRHQPPPQQPQPTAAPQQQGLHSIPEQPEDVPEAVVTRACVTGHDLAGAPLPSIPPQAPGLNTAPQQPPTPAAALAAAAHFGYTPLAAEATPNVAAAQTLAMEHMRRELLDARAALSEARAALDKTRRQRNRAVTQNARLSQRHDVLLALAGLPSSAQPRVAAIAIQSAVRGRHARWQARTERRAAVVLQGAWRGVSPRRRLHASLTAAAVVQGAARAFLTTLRECPSRASMRLEAARLRAEVAALKSCLDGAAACGGETRTATPCSSASSTPSRRSEDAGHAGEGAADGDALAGEELLPRGGGVAEQLEEGFKQALGAVTVFEVEDFLDRDDLVCESHEFADQHGFSWRIWVKPHDKNGHVGLYLVPAEGFDEAHTADFELAIVGRRGKVIRRELRGGRATLWKRHSGHGWPQFVRRDEIERGEAREDDPHGLLHRGSLIVTASKITAVRPKREVDEKRALSRSI